MTKILFISHDASRTGAPILLLRLIKEVKKTALVKIIILLKNGGELEKDFETLGPTFIWNTLTPKSKFAYHSAKFLRKLGLAYITPAVNCNEQLLQEMKEVTIAFNNTITNAALLKEIPLKGKRVFSYFHEMAIITEMMSSKEEVAFLSNISEKIFVPSRGVISFLMKDYNIKENKFAILRYIIPLENTPLASTPFNNTSTEMEVPANKFIIGMCGTMHWRKGYDLLPLLAKAIINDKSVADIHFVWIGTNRKSLEFIILCNDLDKLGLKDFFTFIETKDSIAPYLSKLDVLALPSREDAFPLVVLEAAAFGKPSVCFNNAGGIKDFIGNDAGLMVDYLDIDGMANAILKLKSNPVLKRMLGDRAQQKIGDYANAGEVVKELFTYLNIK